MSKITKTGQVNLPAAVRRALSVQPGDKVELTVLTDRKALMQRRLRPISHERAQELMEERTRPAQPQPPEDADGKGNC